MIFNDLLLTGVIYYGIIMNIGKGIALPLSKQPPLLHYITVLAISQAPNLYFLFVRIDLTLNNMLV